MRGLFAVLFLLLMGGVAYMVVTERGGGDTLETDLRVANDHDETVRDLDRLIEEARQNARRAAELASQIETAAAEAEQSASEVGVLADDNDLALTAERTTARAADDALDAARLMRTYADRMSERFVRTESLTDEAEAIAAQLETVEETQAEARAAARRAAEARAEMAAAEEELDRVEAAASEDALDPIRVTRDTETGGSIVILNDAPIEAQGDADYDDEDDDEDVGQRLEDIFPDDVIEYEDDDEVPYGERG